MTVDLNFSLKVDADIELRLPKLEDVDEIFALTDRNREYLKAYLGWLDEYQKVEDTKRFVEATLADSVSMRALCFAVWFQKKMVGMLSCNNFDYANKLTTIGYWLDKEHQGMGIMTKSLQALVEYAFSSIGLHRIEIRCAVSNVKSQKIPERLGFIREGVLKEAIYMRGSYVDAYLYGLTKTDFSKKER